MIASCSAGSLTAMKKYSFQLTAVCVSHANLRIFAISSSVGASLGLLDQDPLFTVLIRFSFSATHLSRSNVNFPACAQLVARATKARTNSADSLKTFFIMMCPLLE